MIYPIALYSADESIIITPLIPSSCEVHEVINGAYELTMEHPLDPDGIWKELACERIIEVTLPTHAPLPVVYNRVVEVVNSDINLCFSWIWANGHHNKRSASQSGLVAGERLYSCGSVMITIADSRYDDRLAHAMICYRPSDGKYYLMGDYSRPATFTAEDEALIAAAPATHPWPERERFRIRDTQESLADGLVRVTATQLTYDSDQHQIIDLKATSVIANKILQGILIGYCDGITTGDLRTSLPDFDLYNKAGEIPPELRVYRCSVKPMIHLIQNQYMRRNEVSADAGSPVPRGSVAHVGKNPMDALLGSGGYLESFPGEVARIGHSVLIYDSIGGDRGFVLREGETLAVLDVNVNHDEMITAIVPVGKTSSGGDLYMSDDETVVRSPHMEEYGQVYSVRLDVPGATVGSGVTVSAAQALLRAAALAEFDRGCDIPKAVVDVNFIRLRETAEYQHHEELQALEKVYLGDTLHIKAPTLRVDGAIRVTEYTYDVIRKSYVSLRMGSVDITRPIQQISAGGGGAAGVPKVPVDMSELTSAELGAILT